MKKQGSKKTIALIMATVLGLSTVTAMAAEKEDSSLNAIGETTIMPRYIAITDTDTDLILINSTTLNCYGYTCVQQGYKANVTVELQRRGSTWTTIRTWTATGGLSAAVDQNYTNYSSSYKYRVKVTHKSLDSNGNVLESVTTYSSII